MKKIFCTGVLCGVTLLTASAVTSMNVTVGDAPADRGGNSLTINPLDIAHTDSNLFVLLDIDATGLRMKSNREVTLTPMLVSDNAADTVRLKSFTIAGRNRYYHGIRNGAPTPIFLRAGDIDRPINYRDDTPYRDWMATARLVIDTRESGCCNAVEAEGAIPVARLDFTPKTFAPQYLYISPKAEAVKTRALKASAYIDFPVNKTVIYPDYRRNPAELAKIRATIDSVRTDKDITITSLHITGYASPEGSYANNTRLAEGRTEALKQYVQKLYSFRPGLISTSYVPEDWEGLRAYIAADTALTCRDELLAIIDSDLDPDAKDRKLRSAYPGRRQDAACRRVPRPPSLRLRHRLHHTLLHHPRRDNRGDAHGTAEALAPGAVCSSTVAGAWKRPLQRGV